jgi:hypothetical protein
MDGKKFRTQMGDLAMGTALNAAARDYQKVSGSSCSLATVLVNAVHCFMCWRKFRLQGTV